MTVLFIGGALDGELREVRYGGAHSVYTYCGEIRDEGAIDIRTAKPMVGHDAYHISNGIARHESVSEEEVAKRLYHRLAMLDVHREHSRRLDAESLAREGYVITDTDGLRVEMRARGPGFGFAIDKDGNSVEWGQ